MPGWQSTHILSGYDMYLPAVQDAPLLHAVEPEDDVFPVSHAMHAVDAVAGWNLPGWQSTHDTMFAGNAGTFDVYLPAAQV